MLVEDLDKPIVRRSSHSDESKTFHRSIAKRAKEIAVLANHQKIMGESEKKPLCSDGGAKLDPAIVLANHYWMMEQHGEQLESERQRQQEQREVLVQRQRMGDIERNK